MGGHTIAEGGLMGEGLEEAAGLKLAAGLAMAESFGSCSGACNKSPIAHWYLRLLDSGSTLKHK